VSRRARSRPEPISAWLSRVLRDVGLEESAQAARIAEAWSAWLGEDRAEHCRPVLLRGDILEIAADSSARAQTLRLQAPEILKILGERMGEGAPTGLRVRVGWSKDGTDDG